MCHSSSKTHLTFLCLRLSFCSIAEVCLGIELLLYHGLAGNRVGCKPGYRATFICLLSFFILRMAYLGSCFQVSFIIFKCEVIFRVVCFPCDNSQKKAHFVSSAPEWPRIFRGRSRRECPSFTAFSTLGFLYLSGIVDLLSTLMCGAELSFKVPTRVFLFLPQRKDHYPFASFVGVLPTVPSHCGDRSRRILA